MHKNVNKVTADGNKGCEENKTRVIRLRLSGSVWQVIREDFCEPAMSKSGRKVFRSDRPWLQRPRVGIITMWFREKGTSFILCPKFYFQMFLKQ